MLADAMVYSLIMTAENDYILLERKFVRNTLVEYLTVGRHIDHLFVIPLRLKVPDNVENRLHHHHHSGVSAVGVIVHVAARPQAVFAQVVNLYFHQSLLSCPAHYGIAERAVEQFWNNTYYIYSHALRIFCKIKEKKIIFVG